MSDWLKTLLNLDDTVQPDGATWSLEFISKPSGDWTFVAIIACLLVVAAMFWLYKHEGKKIKPAILVALTMLRLVAIAGVIFMLLEPVIVFTHKEYLPTSLPVLIDTSRSMSLNDAYPDEQVAKALAEQLGFEGPDELRQGERLELARRALSTNLFEALSRNGDRNVELFSFSDSLAPIETNQFATLTAEGNTTRLGVAMKETLARYKGLPLSGMVIVTDGQSNSGEDPERAAEAVANAGIPVAVLTVGTEEGPRNALIAKLEVSPAVFVRDPIEIHAIVESRGIKNQAVDLVLEGRLNGGAWEEIERREITLDGKRPQQRITFNHVENIPAHLELRATLGEIENEMSIVDNVGTAKVKVVRERIRVLFVAGSTFPEVQFMRNALTRDNGVVLSSWLMDADEKFDHPGDRPIRRLPMTLDELDQYDCVVLYDPDPEKWPAEWSDLLYKFVSRNGGGLVYIAGERMTAKNFDRSQEPIASFMKLLPVVQERGLFNTDVAVQLSSREPWKLEITSDGKADPIFTFAEDPIRNDQIISYLPGMFWHYPVTRAKPGATVLARHGDPRMRNQFGRHVLVSTHLFGPGRTYFIGFDSTYRWRYLDDSYFDLFWARVIDRAGRNKQLGGRFPFTLETDQLGYQPGDQVSLSARFRFLDDLDAGLESLRGEVQQGDQPPEPFELLPDDGERGTFTGTFPVPKAGKHFVRVWTGGDERSGDAKAATLEFDVSPAKLEYARLTLDRALCSRIAELSGGKVYSISSIDQLPECFTLGKVERILENRKAIWDAPLCFGLVLLLIIAEWICRKLVRLI